MDPSCKISKNIKTELDTCLYYFLYYTYHEGVAERETLENLFNLLLSFMEQDNKDFAHYITSYNANDKCVDFIYDHGQDVLKIAYYIGSSECLELLLKRGETCCENWQEWKSVDTDFIRHYCKFADYEVYEDVVKTIKEDTHKVMTKWRSFLPEWSIYTHKLYPSEFKKIVKTCLNLWNRLKKNWKIQICKDIRHLLINYVAKTWREKLDEPPNLNIKYYYI